MGGDAELESFADGLTEDIITGLSRIGALWVIARNTMFTYKGRAIDVRTVAKDLGVNYIVNGTVRKAEGRLRMTTQLIEAETGHHIWAAKMDRPSAGLFELQDDFAQCVVASVQVQLIVSEGKSVKRRAKPASRLGDLLARSLGRLYQPTADGLKEMVSLAEKALELDPNSGEACRALAAGIWHQAYRGIIPWDKAAADRVMMLAQRAVVAEESDEYSHWMMALAHLMACQHDRAIVSLRRALDINPSFSLGYGTLGTVLAWGGEPDASIANNELALRINPSDPLNPHRYFGLALAHYLAGRYANALEYAGIVVQLRPDWWLALIIYAASLAQVGRAAEARTACADLRRTNPDMTVASLDPLPFAKASDRDHVANGLRKAGLPDK
jgi:TolB-like protein